MNQLIEGVKITEMILDSAADNETLTSASALDMAGYEGVLFMAVAQQGNAADFILKAQQGALAAMTDAADLEDSGVTFTTAADADAMAALDIYQPQERYVRPAVVVEDLDPAVAVVVIAVQYKARVEPVEQDIEYTMLYSPDEGTA